MMVNTTAHYPLPEWQSDTYTYQVETVVRNPAGYDEIATVTRDVTANMLHHFAGDPVAFIRECLENDLVRMVKEKHGTVHLKKPVRFGLRDTRIPGTYQLIDL